MRFRRMGKYSDMQGAELTGFLEWVMDEVKYDRWLFGHRHTDAEMDGKLRVLWLTRERLDDIGFTGFL